MTAPVNMIGRSLGRLTVLARAGSSPDRHALWRCRCACGGEVVAEGTALRLGHTQSCGCLQSEEAARTIWGARAWLANAPAPRAAERDGEEGGNG